jgi:Icc-related predicted phosphoesterase
MPFKLLALSDIHGKKSCLGDILERITPSRPDLVLVCGDITHFATRAEELTSLFEVIERSGFPYCYVLGNCDPPELRGGVDGIGTCLESNCLPLGSFNIIGAGGATPTPFGTPFEIEEQEIIESLERGRSKCQAAGENGLIIVTHNPPRGDIVDKTRAGTHVGSPKLLRYILEKNPLFVLSGHIHEAVGTEIIGATTVLNPGPALRGFYALVEIDSERRSVLVNLGSL